MAEVPPAPPPEPQLGTSRLSAVRTFVERCSDAASDPYQGVYERPFNVFRVPEQGTDNAQLLTAKVLSSPLTAPMYFLSCVQHTIGSYKVIVIHHPFVYRAPLGQPDELDGMSFALTGDVTDGQMPTIIDWPRDLLESVTPEGRAVTALTAQAVVTYFDANLAAQWLPAVVPAADRQEIRVRRGIFCPTFLAQAMMTKAMRPREAFRSG
jgi:hypothetical protein